MAKLEVYVSDQCWSCEESRRIVADIAPHFPDVQIMLRDINDDQRPDSVFATPTYILNGRTIFLGNPTRDELREKLASAEG